jgi:ankyrin repeat protein
MRTFLLPALLPPILTATLTVTEAAQSGAEIRQAVNRALPPLERSTAAFVAKRACVSCHHNILSILMFQMAHERGVNFDPAILTAVELKTLRSLRGPSAFDDAVQAATLNDPTPDDSYLLMAAHAAGLKPGLTTAVYARRLVQWQRDGHWVTSDFRPPHSSSVFTATATAVRAIGLYMPAELHSERDACILRARHWLFTERPTSTEDAAFRLMGLVWASGSANEIDAARHDLLGLRKLGGGWPELPGYQPDAYSTGESLFALHESGLPTTGADLKFLISTQAADGTWRVRTRMVSPAQVSPEYFPTGFPYEKDEFLSYAGSAWATMALLTAMPKAQFPLPVIENSETAPPWARTALFGTPWELTALLDKGLAPNSTTDKGTTLLMMAAGDAEKAAENVKILLARGADPSYSALTVAAASRGTAPAIKRLLDAGVAAKDKPLLFASMTGDLGNVKLLLAHGADRSAALAQAVTFGYPDIVRALIAAGAPVKLTDSSGINLLHWAVIANRPAVIPLLVEAGVPIDAKDEFDFTPLMYAATIDFGDTKSLEALLKAGADPNIRNGEGRTTLEQARFYRHIHLEAVLRRC